MLYFKVNSRPIGLSLSLVFIKPTEQGYQISCCCAIILWLQNQLKLILMNCLKLSTCILNARQCVVAKLFSFAICSNTCSEQLNMFHFQIPVGGN